MVELITWPSIFEPIKIGFFFSRFFGAQLSGVVQKLVFLKKNWSKKGFQKKKLCTYFFGQLRFISLLLDDVTRCFSRVCKNPYKNRVFFCTPFY